MIFGQQILNTYLGFSIIVWFFMFSIISESVERVTETGIVYDILKNNDMTNKDIKLFTIVTQCMCWGGSILTAFCPILNILALYNCITRREIFIELMVKNIEDTFIEKHRNSK